MKMAVNTKLRIYRLNHLLRGVMRIPVDTRSLIPVISVHSISNLQYRWQS